MCEATAACATGVVCMILLTLLVVLDGIERWKRDRDDEEP